EFPEIQLSPISPPVRPASNKTESDFENELKKLSFYQRYWKLAKEYWYLLIPVHVASSGIIFGFLFLIAKSGVDVEVLVEYGKRIGIPEVMLNPLKVSGLGNIAIALVLYKLITPLRYAVTVAGTLGAIKIGIRKGWVKPMPSRDKMKSMIQKKLKEREIKKLKDRR
ncbi:hypothetical protein B4U79_06563, partial [Dinothrombium tinctorium]